MEAKKMKTERKYLVKFLDENGSMLRNQRFTLWKSKSFEEAIQFAIQDAKRHGCIACAEIVRADEFDSEYDSNPKLAVTSLKDGRLLIFKLDDLNSEELDVFSRLNLKGMLAHFVTQF